MSTRKYVILLFLFLAPAESFPCTLEGPMEILSSRENYIYGIPEGSFESEVRRYLKKPSDRFEAVEEDDPEDQRKQAESMGVSREEVSKIVAMRGAADGDTAYDLGKGLPPAVRAYTAGAVSYHKDDDKRAEFYFKKVLALPREDQRLRAVWAEFMLGRIDGSYVREDRTKAVEHYKNTRELVRYGLPDPLGLAVASLGEEALIYLDTGDHYRAVALYAEQVAHGSYIGLLSLQRALSSLLSYGDMSLRQCVMDPVIGRLVMLYMYTHTIEIQEDALLRAMKQIIEDFEKKGLDQVDGAGWLASAAYERGFFDLAGRFAAMDKSALANWVTAKVLLRSGDWGTAIGALSQAIKGFPASDENMTDIELYRRCRLHAEKGALHLMRGDYIEALALVYQALIINWKSQNSNWDYWPDAAYLAERVLTIDELKSFIDANLPPLSQRELDEAYESGGEIPAVELRAILARRMLRDGRLKESLEYFDDEYLRGVAQEYVDNLDRAGAAWWGRVARAQALYNAALIANFEGMEILGFELAPDWALWDGNFAFGPMDIDGPLVSEDERKRFYISRPKPDKRYHYRFISSKHLFGAAELLPRSSQAFAAVLCQAASWNPADSHNIYEYYIAEGPYVRWAKNFGRYCQQPDFSGARWRVWEERYEVLRKAPRKYKVGGVAVIGFSFLLLTWLGMKASTKWRRNRAEPAN